MSTGHTPAPSADPVQARKGQWLHRLLVSFTGIGALIMAFNLVGPSTQMTGTTGPNGAAVLALLGLTALNRRGQTTVAAAGLVGVIAGNIVAAAYFLPLSLAPALAYPVLFTVVIATAGVFLSWRVVLALVPLVSAVTSIYYLSSSAVPALVAYRRTDPDGVFAITSILIIRFVVTGALAWLSNRLISETLADLQQRAAELAAANQALVVQSQQEAALGQNIGSLAAELTSVNTRQVTGVSQQARAIREAVAAVASLQTTADEIAGIAQEVTRAAASAHASVAEAQGLVRQGRLAVEQNRQHVAAWLIQQQVVERALAHIIRAVQTIHDLADEAQLLALNATIEAAGAGPAGRRFNVVAQEVQHLAGRSQELVSTIQGQIQDLQRAAALTQQTAQQSMAVAVAVDQQTTVISTAQDRVVAAVAHTAARVTHIEAIVTTQRVATEQLARTMTQIDQVATTTQQATTALDRVTRELTRAAHQLVTTIARWCPQPDA